MSARIVHFGPDDCNRVIVLQNAGYAIDICPSFQELHSAFERSARPDAVLMTAYGETERREAVTFVRAHPPTPLVLFERSGYVPDESEFDLIIPPLTLPSEWLRKIADLIRRSRTLLTDSQQAKENSALTRKKA